MFYEERGIKQRGEGGGKEREGEKGGSGEEDEVRGGDRCEGGKERVVTEDTLAQST